MKKTRYQFLNGFRMTFSVLMILLSGLIMAQEHHGTNEEEGEGIMVTAYKTPFSYDLESTVKWELRGRSSKVITQGTGALKDIVLPEPGMYMLSIKEAKTHASTSCDHMHYPEKINVSVSPMKMIFDFSTVRFSRNITGETTTEGIILSVDADYASYDNKPAVYSQNFTTAGIGTTVSGKLKNGEIVLKPGNNTLEFVLDGKTSKGNYLMFDFVDVNGQVQTYDLTQKIQ